MKKAWKVVLVIVLTAVVLGAICTGVGIVTGANVDSIYAMLDSHYHIGMYWEYAQQVFAALIAAI